MDQIDRKTLLLIYKALARTLDALNEGEELSEDNERFWMDTEELSRRIFDLLYPELQ